MRKKPQNVRQTLENSEVIIEQLDRPLHFTVSIGVTTIVNHDVTIDKMLQEADAALYKAKKTGRNKVVALF